MIVILWISLEMLLKGLFQTSIEALIMKGL